MSDVRAAGGVILRDSSAGPEALLIHRPKYDDWSFPKGKLDPGESFEDAAAREVLEETGLVCRLEAPLSTVRYRDGAGRSKEVRYWMMRVESGDIERRSPDPEVDESRWIRAGLAGELLTYERDRELLAEAVAVAGGPADRTTT